LRGSSGDPLVLGDEALLLLLTLGVGVRADGGDDDFVLDFLSGGYRHGLVGEGLGRVVNFRRNVRRECCRVGRYAFEL